MIMTSFKRIFISRYKREIHWVVINSYSPVKLILDNQLHQGCTLKILRGRILLYHYICIFLSIFFLYYLIALLQVFALDSASQQPTCLPRSNSGHVELQLDLMWNLVCWIWSVKFSTNICYCLLEALANHA